MYSKSRPLCLLLLGCLFILPHSSRGDSLLTLSPGPEDFLLAGRSSAAPIVLPEGTPPSVARAAADFQADVERVTGLRPRLETGLPEAAPAVVIAGVIGQSALLDRLVSEHKLDASRLSGAWESFVIQVVPQPFPGIERALVIAGSDRRGAVFGLYEVSEQIGVSPWYWWADVAPKHQETLAIAAGTHRFGPPSVKYRGIFINDEDWGLVPWAAHTFDPATGNLGPKTYARVFELLLRLKANTLWPGMHPTTTPFNAIPENARLADEYGIVMGSSHAEPMLRNNVGEWTAPHEEYNYATNAAGVRKYWEERLETNGRYENIYTLGMRGIHDSGMQGPKTKAGQIALLEKIFADQRELISRHVRPEVEQVPQMFCAYKEVLDLYRGGLRVPDDVTIVWPDDNFGYVRTFASPAERGRSGGFGVYYHASYLGRPLSYLWLCTTPPALIWSEMRRSFDHGADRLWMLNVGDIKPAEIAIDFFLRLGWNVEAWSEQSLASYPREWAARQFGPEHAAEIGEILASYYLLNYERKPEHLQWWLPNQPPAPSTFSADEVKRRLAMFAALKARTEALRPQIPDRLRDAFDELVHYPVVGSALANQRFFEGERGNAEAATTADRQLKSLTARYNEEIAGGKWRGIMALEPADKSWSSMRIAPWQMPTYTTYPKPTDTSAPRIFRAGAAYFSSSRDAQQAGWRRVAGLGQTGAAVTVLPSTMPAVSVSDASTQAPRLSYDFTAKSAGKHLLRIQLLPTHPIAGTALRLAVGVDQQPPRLVELKLNDGDATWAQGVLEARRELSTELSLTHTGSHTLEIYGLDAGVVIDELSIETAAAPVSQH
jgi:hypothetical protein